MNNRSGPLTYFFFALHRPAFLLSKTQQQKNRSPLFIETEVEHAIKRMLYPIFNLTTGIKNLINFLSLNSYGLLTNTFEFLYYLSNISIQIQRHIFLAPNAPSAPLLPL